MYAVPGFYIVATKKSYKNIAQMELEVYQKCLLFVQRVRRLLKEEYGVNRAFIYYDEHYKNLLLHIFGFYPFMMMLLKKII